MALASKTLPNDVMFEILTSAHLDDLTTWRQVSHELLEITKETSFRAQHSLKTKTVYGYLTECSKPYGSSKYSFTSEFPVKCPIESLSIMKRYYVTIEAVSQCRGMICCLDRTLGKERYYVCKPATGQCKTIPNPKLRYRTIATAMVASSIGPLDFKIIRFSIPNNNDNKTLCEIFDSRTWTWRRSKDIQKYLYFPGQVFGRKTRVVFAYGSVHWLIKDFVENIVYLFAFDVEKETWKLISVPSKHMEFSKLCCSKITAENGKLCFINMEDETEMNVWTMKQYNNGETRWRKVHNLKEPKILEGWLDFFLDFFHRPELPFYN